MDVEILASIKSLILRGGQHAVVELKHPTIVRGHPGHDHPFPDCLYMTPIRLTNRHIIYPRILQCSTKRRTHVARIQHDSGTFESCLRQQTANAESVLNRALCGSSSQGVLGPLHPNTTLKKQVCTPHACSGVSSVDALSPVEGGARRRRVPRTTAKKTSSRSHQTCSPSPLPDHLGAIPPARLWCLC